MKTLFTTSIITGRVATLIGHNRDSQMVSLTLIDYQDWSQYDKEKR